jgi:tetratricopeptide (TPR) repeat protein
MRREKQQQVAPRQALHNRHLIALAILAVAVLLAYGNSFQNPLVQDSRLLPADTRLTAVTSENLKLIFQHSYWWPNGNSELYRPLTSLSYLFNHSVLGNEYRPAGYHLVNVLLHLANACLVYRLALLLVGGVWPAFFTAAIWALHPVATESVANIVGRADELAALAVLGTLLLYIRSTAEQGRRRLPWLVALALVATLGVFAKENAAMAVGAAVLYDFTWRLRQLRENPLGVAAGYAAFAPSLAAMWLARAAVFAHSLPPEVPFLDNPLVAADFLTARLTAIKVVGQYAGLLVWPAALSCDRSYNQVPLADWRDGGVIAALAVIAVLILLAAACYSRRKAVFFFIGFSALALFPAANFAVIIGTIMADRFLYLPAAGFAACVTIAVYAAARRFRWRPYAAPALLAIVTAACGARTYARNQDWKSELALWRSAVQSAPQSFKAHLALATALLAEGPAHHGEAMPEVEKAAAILDPVPDRLNFPDLFYTIGLNFVYEGDLTTGPERVDWYRRGLRTLLRCASVERETSAAVHRREMALGKPIARNGKMSVSDLYNDIGQTWLRLGNPQKAMEAYHYARRLAPQDPRLYRSMAEAYEAAGRRDEVMPAMLEAFLLDNSAQSTAEVLSAYGRIDPESCAATFQDGQRVLNTGCPAVHRDTCAAYRNLIAAYRESNLDELATRTVAAARERHGCELEPDSR